MDYKEYYKDVAKIRHTIASMMKKHGLVSAVLVDDATYGGLNPFYAQICSNGAFGIEFYYGTPNKILTPLGEIEIQCAIVGYTGAQLRDFMKEFNETFGVETIVEGKQEWIGYIGPYCSITKLPWKPDEKFPTFQAKQGTQMSFYSDVKGTPRAEEAVVPYEDAKQGYKSIMKEVNSELKASGEGRFVIEDSKNK